MACGQLMHVNFNVSVEDLLQEGIKVLDACCGTGAVDYPQSTFVRNRYFRELSHSCNIPPNCAFLKANTLEGLPFVDGKFGVRLPTIHGRGILAIGLADCRSRTHAAPNPGG
ncbi:hypothetical protein BC936DRAFT_143951 [Jimgerdemannia flammicorona]|uniref:Methyltransferase domain-containing protein n=1 Tax=Jimgerdemannia flammicorona TaxID=994334 RepID=A0A433DMR4_9FUNG|nr:hypothetical protein BC936DRAFT_143951 [Jimgerdemannia flammicorona]